MAAQLARGEAGISLVADRSIDDLDVVALPLPGENPSAEVRMVAIVHGYELDDDPCRLSAEGSVDGSAITSDSSGNPSAERFPTSYLGEFTRGSA